MTWAAPAVPTQPAPEKAAAETAVRAAEPAAETAQAAPAPQATRAAQPTVAREVLVEPAKAAPEESAPEAPKHTAPKEARVWDDFFVMLLSKKAPLRGYLSYLFPWTYKFWPNINDRNFAKAHPPSGFSMTRSKNC